MADLSFAEWIVGVSGALMTAGIIAIIGFLWRMSNKVATATASFTQRMDDKEKSDKVKFEAMGKVIELTTNSLAERVELQISHITERMDSIGKFDGRLQHVEKIAESLREAHEETKPWRKDVADRLAAHDRKLDRLEDKVHEHEQQLDSVEKKIDQQSK